LTYIHCSLPPTLQQSSSVVIKQIGIYGTTLKRFLHDNNNCFLGSAQLGYFSASAQQKSGSTQLNYFTAQLLRLRLTGLIGYNMYNNQNYCVPTISCR